MGDMIKTSEVIKKLKQNGCKFSKHRTNHDFWYSPITNTEFPVPRHPAIKKSTAMKIYKQAGIK